MVDDYDNILMYKTLFRLLRHDTRNTFVKLDALVGDLQPGAVSDMITDSILELKDLISSTTGFIDGKKRILSLYDIVSGLSLTKDKINITNHHRINFTHTDKIYLFLEVTELFNHAILNIVENALKYSPDDQMVDVSLTREGSFLIVSVKDNGIGIPAELRDKIFEQGYRTGDACNGFDGTGIGLWITKNIVDSNNGTIEVKDNKEGGSEFIVKIPAYYTESFESSMEIVLTNFMDDPKELDGALSSVRTLIDLHNPPAEYHYDSLVFANLLNYLRKEKKNKSKTHFKDKLEEIKAKNPYGKSVIIVDDSTYVHYYLGAFFADLGYKVVDFAFNGREGIELYEKHSPDLITLDITMPVMSGVEASEEILKIDKEANLLFLSGLGEHEGLIKVLNEKMGIDGYGILTKPFNLQDLKESLNEFNL